MTKLNLQAKGQEQELILAYLSENASSILADKINRGVYIEKDGKKLLNKKTLDGFMKYACEEAHKLAEKNSRSACVKDNVVYGWAIHYFEEDSIEGDLFNEDGTPFKAKPAVKKAVNKPIPVVKKDTNKQLSLFDSLVSEEPPSSSEQPEDDDVNNPSPEEVKVILAELDKEDKEEPKSPKGSPMYRRYMELQAKHPNDIVALRLGDFYEVLGENAEIISNELGLTLTGRDCRLESRVPMIGFPYHAAEIYFRKIRKNHGLFVSESDSSKYYPKESAEQIINRDTGEIIESQTQSKIDPILLSKLSVILGDVFIVR